MIVVGVESVGDLDWGCDDVCGGLDLHGDGVEVDVGQSGICRKVDDELEVESVGDAVVIWNVVGLVEEKVLVHQLGYDGHEAEELESVELVQECVYVFGLHVEEVVGEREEWRFLPARVVEELKVEV